MARIAIEDNPKLRGGLRTAFEWSFTSLMWALWLYLFLPLVSLVLWAVGAHYVYSSLFEAAALNQLLAMFSRMGWAVLIIFCVLRGWGYYNYYVFGRRNRRRENVNLDRAEIGRHFGLSAAEVRDLQGRKEIVWESIYSDIKSPREARCGTFWEQTRN